jgi:hypothetical protein
MARSRACAANAAAGLVDAGVDPRPFDGARGNARSDALSERSRCCRHGRLVARATYCTAALCTLDCHLVVL